MAGTRPLYSDGPIVTTLSPSNIGVVSPDGVELVPLVRPIRNGFSVNFELSRHEFLIKFHLVQFRPRALLICLICRPHKECNNILAPFGSLLHYLWRRRPLGPHKHVVIRWTGRSELTVQKVVPSNDGCNLFYTFRNVFTLLILLKAMFHLSSAR